MAHREKGHLYKHGAKYRKEKEFQEKYGKKKGVYIYGATVGRVARERRAQRGNR